MENQPAQSIPIQLGPIPPIPSKPFWKTPQFLLIIPIVLLIIGVGAFLLHQQTSKTQVQPSTAPKQATNSATPASTNPTTTAKYGDIKVEITVESTASGKIKGTVTVTNNGPQGLADLYYNIVLHSPQTQTTKIVGGKEQIITNQRSLVTYLDSTDGFSLESGEKKNFPFEMEYSPHLKTDKYTMLVTIVSSLGNPISMAAPLEINLAGANDLITSNNSSCKVVIGSKEYPPNEAPAIERGGLAQGKCSFTNTSTNPVNVKSNLKYAILHVSSYPQSQKLTDNQTKTITFQANETKDLTFALPTNLDPQVYESYLFLTDNQNNPQSLGTIFRWTIKGASGRVEKISLDKDYYAKGGVAKITSTIDPSMDLYWRSTDSSLGTELPNGQLIVSLHNSNNQLCGQKTSSLPDNFLTPKQLVIDIPITELSAIFS